jgi:D-alanyl-D-alanine carboxypeptidase
MITPGREHFFIEPEGQTSTLDQELVIIFPIVETVLCFGFLFFHISRIPAKTSPLLFLQQSHKYVGVYSSPAAPVKFTITRDGATLFFQPPGQSAVPLEATAQDKFQIEGAVVIEFDATKNQMIIKRRGWERVFTKEK